MTRGAPPPDADPAGSRRDRASPATELLVAAAALDTLLDPFVWVGADRTITYANEAFARLIDRDRHDLAGRDLDEAAPAALHDVLTAVTDGVLRDHLPTEVERRVDRPERAWYRVVAHQLHDGVAIQLRDITAVRTVGERLATVQHMETLGTLAGGLAHDFNNLLTVIAGHAELLEDALAHDDEALVDIAAIRDAAQRAAALTARLLAFGRRQFPRPVELDLATMVDDLAPLLHSVVPPHASLELRPSTAPLVRADPSSVAQALVNVVVNAGEAVGEAGRVVVATHVERVDGSHDGTGPTGTYAAISVRDDGGGMPPHVAERAIEPFFTTRSERGATGLGLSAAYRALAEAGGHLVVDSELGRGTTVRLLLPALADG